MKEPNLLKEYPAELFSLTPDVERIMEHPGFKEHIEGESKTYEDTISVEPSENKNKLINVMASIVGDPRNMPLLTWTQTYKDLWTRIFAESIRRFGAKNYEQLVKVSDLNQGLIGNFLDPRQNPQVEPGRMLDLLMGFLESRWPFLICKWHCAGRKNYTISSGLAQKLKQTKLKGYPARDLALPYDTIYVDLRNYGQFGHIALEGCLFMYIDEQRVMVSLMLDRSYQDQEFERMIAFTLNDRNLDTIVESSFNNSKEADQRFTQPWKDALSYIVNVVLYATMPDAEQQFEYYDKGYKKLKERLSKIPKKSKKHKKVLEQLKKTSNSGHVYLGGSITVDRTEERIISQGDGKRVITVRTLVSGHWRNQPYGKELQETKRIWIEPFWRGPEGAPITQRRHHLQ